MMVMPAINEETELRRLVADTSADAVDVQILMSIAEAKAILIGFDLLRTLAHEIESTTIERCASVVERHELPLSSRAVAQFIRDLPPMSEVN